MGEHSGRIGDDFIYDAGREEGSLGDDASSLQPSSYTSSHDPNEVDDFDNDVTDYHAGEDGTTADKAFADNLARSLSRDVRLWRTIVSLMLLITALLVTIGTYVVLTNEDTRQYQDAFESVAYQLGDAVQTKSWAIGNTLESRAESLTSYMFDSVRTWPFATLSHFEVRGENTRRETQSSIFAWAPLLVTGGDKQEWNTNYSVQQGNIWLQESYARAIQTAGAESEVGQAYTAAAQAGGAIPDSVYRVDGDDLSGPTAESSLESWLPLWQISPPPLDPYPINFNLMSSPDIAQVVNYVADHQVPVVSDRFMRDPIIRHWVQQYDDITPEHDHVVDHDYDAATDHETHKHEGGSERRRLAHEEVNGYNENYENTAGHMFLVYPVFNTLDDGNGQNSNSSNTNASTRQMTGIFLELVRWDWILTDTLHTDTEEVLAVVKNTCGENDYAYKVNGMDATFWGVGDGDEERFGSDEIRSPVKHFGGVHVETSESCDFYLHVYPTKVFRESFDSDKATVFTVIVALAFGVTALFFLIYVRIVQRRQTKVMATAARTNAIVTSLFPSNVRDRIMKDAEEAANQNKELAPFLPGMGEAATKKLRTFLDTENPASNDNQLVMFKTKPIADLFPETTVMFGDLVGFTAWSSVREPTQVFQLLETIYHSFDEIVRRRRVFKVETVGDCYVAVVGLPDPRKDHAVIMARFARDCLQTVNDLTKKLEVTLGPDTGDLQIRTGLHSGPVTAGVLRGEKSRFQLFGDTVNTAARMESTGSPSKIQLSSETADLLIAAGKTNWIREREEKVRAKGKGELQTYWLEVRHDGTASVTSGSSNSDLHDHDDLKMPQPSAKPVKDSPSVVRPLDAKAKRLVDWNCDQMIRLLKHVVARRNAQGRRSSAVPGSATDKQSAESRDSILQKKGTVLEEVREIIRLPNFDPNVYRNHDDPDAVQLSDDVLQQLHDYVSTIATLYRDNPFHNFEHASHVTMSVSKLLSRIVSPQDINNKSHEEEQKSEQKIEDYAWEVHKSTYGITSDPLTQFAVVFSALIHDVDHTGVPNATLVQENAKIAELYKQKSVAEQNSVDLAWDMLMDSKYSALQNVIYTNSSELERFRQLVVNSVMATDIVDKDLKGLRNARWDKAFKDVEEDEDTDVNRKATIVIEHLIQASDVAHTMQHWHIFRKWNERLFQEMHKAYREGRAEKDPSEFWFKGEIGFFDFYIIPLAKKLKECGVFGVSSDEYLNYAEKNREEWIVKGKEIVEQMLERVPKKSETPSQVPPETAP